MYLSQIKVCRLCSKADHLHLSYLDDRNKS